MRPVRAVLCAALVGVLCTVVPPAGAPHARADVRRTAPCAIADRPAGAPAVGVPPAQAALGVEELWRFSRGTGRTVAVIDTGVAAHPRLHHLAPGVDLVGGNAADAPPGHADCDAHGTLVAGIIAAAPSAGDGFAGVAPDATILSIRQSSSKFDDRGAGGRKDAAGDEPVGGSGIGTIGTLAQAVRIAADRGADVINISEVACGGGVGALRSPALADAVAHAAARDAVLVVAAGNTRGDGAACRQNATARDPLHPYSRGWDSAYTDVAPAHYAGAGGPANVITVGSVDPDGTASQFSLAGPWVTVAAPGTGIVSLANDPAGGLADRVRTARGVSPIQGTSFAAPYVSGLAALIRARYPELSAPEVVDRIAATAVPGAHRWEPTVGYGVIDPIAALTAPAAAITAPPGPQTAAMRAHPASAPLAVPGPAEPPNTAPRTRALLGTLAGLLILGAIASAAGVSAAARRRRDRAG